MEKKRHIISYLGDFLFTPERARTRVEGLSGGECNRLLLARLLTKPANVLVMDEPTNDLDVETLELLEELLSNYDGTLLLVSHDRAFLDNVVTSTFVFEGNGVVDEFIGGYEDWLWQRKKTKEKAVVKKAAEKVVKKTDSNKLSFKEKTELEALPKTIESLEEALSNLQSKVSEQSFYDNDQDTIDNTLKSLSEAEETLSQTYERWETLEARK